MIDIGLVLLPSFCPSVIAVKSSSAVPAFKCNIPCSVPVYDVLDKSFMGAQ